ncbi:lipopolysaccharide kinase InaA family protein [Bacteroides sp.]|uniref:lipopolysaccharide kinase InaA family protein n=1 Tax=Bacteroides sp. TaxID=29523 RepID=UPI002610228B|nr:lipopolysaccharide kinase InaA family protein [Bacteroides sp.]MDD3036352.1 lipopolysaccharide kinase InaA family protein [Bacteroides sp.]
MRTTINPKYECLHEQIRRIPELFEKKGEMIYEARNVLKRTLIGDVDVVVKSFKQPHIVNRVVYSFFRKSKATRSYIYSTEIINHGFCSPEPVAVIEQFRFKLLTNSYYICCYDNGETVRGLMSGTVAGNEEKLRAFARYTVDLHRTGILHLDYSPGNILIHSTENGYSFSLVDVNRMSLVADVDCETVAENLRRLCNSREVLNYIVGEYASIRGWDIKKMQERATWYSDKFFADFIFRRTAKKIHGQHIPSIILCFKTFRRLRKLLAKSSPFSRWLYKKEKQMYDTYFSQYDYRHVFSSEYTTEVLS